jgi:hypothetical protein
MSEVRVPVESVEGRWYNGCPRLRIHDKNFKKIIEANREKQ